MFSNASYINRIYLLTSIKLSGEYVPIDILNGEQYVVATVLTVDIIAREKGKMNLSLLSQS